MIRVLTFPSNSLKQILCIGLIINKFLLQCQGKEKENVIKYELFSSNKDAFTQRMEWNSISLPSNATQWKKLILPSLLKNYNSLPIGKGKSQSAILCMFTREEPCNTLSSLLHGNHE